MRDILLVAAGGAIGASARFAIGVSVGRTFEGRVPWHTFGINVLGAFLLGLLMAWALGAGGRFHESALVFLGTGVLGGFTTFSTFSYETVALLERGALLAGLGYVTGSVIAGVVAAAAGVALGKTFLV